MCKKHWNEQIEKKENGDKKMSKITTFNILKEVWDGIELMN